MKSMRQVVSFSSMLDIGKLIQYPFAFPFAPRFSSMLDIGKLILVRVPFLLSLRFSSMLDIGKLIRKPSRAYAG